MTPDGVRAETRLRGRRRHLDEDIDYLITVVRERAATSDINRQRDLIRQSTQSLEDAARELGEAIAVEALEGIDS